jgi:hypothetical protein
VAPRGVLVRALVRVLKLVRAGRGRHVDAVDERHIVAELERRRLAVVAQRDLLRHAGWNDSVAESHVAS